LKEDELRQKSFEAMMVEELKKFQIKFSKRVKLFPLEREPGLIAGCDVGYFENELAKGAIVVMRYPEFKIIETVYSIEKITFPYIPGYLSFREAPLLLKVFQRLKNRPDLILVDGQGIAHPRKAGLAVHLGVELEIPTIGCAKKPLLKFEGELPKERGSKLPVYLTGELLGYVVRTRTGVSPLFVSPGNLITPEEAVEWVLKTAVKFRIPEPLREAHRLSMIRI
jgi:deoxyribonuclease V